MTTAIGFIVLGLLIGGVVAWLIASSRAKSAEAVNKELRGQIQQRDFEMNQIRSELDAERQSKVEALTRLEEAQKSFEEQKVLLETMKKEMTDTFNALAKSALESNNESFLTLASERLGKIVEETKGKLGEHQTAIDGLVKPLHEALKRYEEQIHAIESRRRQDYGSLEEQIKMLSSTAGNLVTALRKPHIRGRWGEIALRNVVELAGMSSQVDFKEQVIVKDEDVTKKPDMVIRLPGGRVIVVDSKVSIDALLDAVSATSEGVRREALRRHAQQVKDQISRLCSKAYWEQFEKSPEVAVLFMEESSLVSALEVDPSLIEVGLSKKVLVATPTTLFALLTAVAYGWRQEQITKNAERIAVLGKELYERIGVWADYINEIGKGLSDAIKAYNSAVSSMASRLLVSVKRFKELGVTTSKEIPELTEVEQTPRNLDFIE